MLYGILGDIHANPSALRAVVDRLEAAGVERYLSVGDIVGYGAAPGECIALVRELGAEVVKGNHDAACTGEIDLAYFNPYARAAVEWTCARLDGEELRWLRDLPLVRHLEHCSLVHGTLDHPERFDYVQSPEDADVSLEGMQRPVCFAGHTHVPVTLMRHRFEPERTAWSVAADVDLSQVARAIVNVGAIGQPRDEDHRAAYALFDSELRVASIRRVDYDIEREAARIRAAGLPSVLADRLFLGV